MPIAVRFFAFHGELIAGHLSEVEHTTGSNGVVYKTVRNERVEKSTKEFLRAVNYTGFGATWWWMDFTGTPYLIDFNARLERHACMNAVLSEKADLDTEPCHVFITHAESFGKEVCGCL